MYQEYSDEINFVGIAGRDEEAAIREFISSLDVGEFPHVVDLDGSIWAEYGITTQPSFIFINDDGSTETRVGALGVDGISELLDQLLSS